MNYKLMVEDIDKFVSSDWGFEVVDGHYPNKPFTQKEAKAMSKVLGEIYRISHQIHCRPCRLGGKYERN